MDTAKESLHKDLQAAAQAHTKRTGDSWKGPKWLRKFDYSEKVREGTPTQVCFIFSRSVPKNTKVPHEYGLELVSLGLVVDALRIWDILRSMSEGSLVADLSAVER